jgi:amidohydrolase
MLPLSLFNSKAQDLFEYAQRLRRDFHRFPELGFQEIRSAGVIAGELRALGLEVSTGIAQTGVVACLEGTHPGPVILLRFDMDALPITEETGAEYQSMKQGIMHACGHDGHMAIGLTAARMLHEMRNELAGTVKLVFQPAEEGLGGAERMIAEGVLADPRPAYAIGMHLWNNKPLGWLGITPGPVMAAAEVFSIEVNGKGGHGALPHLAVDPLTTAAQMVSSLQTIVSRNVSPLDAAVVSVTMIHGGDTFNVIPERVNLQGTIRTFRPEVRDRVLESFDRIAHSTAEAGGCEVKVEIKSLTPAVVNDEYLTGKMADLASRILPHSNIENNFQTMGSEDMAFFLKAIPGCYLFIGSANSDLHFDAPHHHPRFDFDERALVQGAALISAAAASLLQ